MSRIFRTSSLAFALGVLPLTLPVFALWQPSAPLTTAPLPSDDPYNNRLAILDPAPRQQEQRTRILSSTPTGVAQAEPAVLLRDWTYTDDFGNTLDR